MTNVLNIEFRVSMENELLPSQKAQISTLTQLCFGNVDPTEIEECFYADIYGHICGFRNTEIISHLLLHKRKILFDGKTITISGAVGACVKKSHRKKGIAKAMMQFGLDILKNHGCDLACLTVDPENGSPAIQLYTKLGFSKHNRHVSFTDLHGNIRFDSDVMFIPLKSESLFNHVMTSKEIFHYGNGYW